MPTDVSDAPRLLAFAATWCPYGGGSARDILVTFGLSELEYFGRLRALLQLPADKFDIDPQVWATITDVCRSRLHAAWDDDAQRAVATGMR